jgi:hypothetical protein
MNLQVFDDRKRMDTQQGYLTRYIHQPSRMVHMQRYRSFCSNYWYAHHVSAGLMKEMDAGAQTHRSTIPKITPPSEACGMSLSFNSAKHHTKGYRAPSPPVSNCYCHLD